MNEDIVFILPRTFESFLDWLHLSWESGEVSTQHQIAERASSYQYQTAEWLFGASEEFAKKVSKCDKTIQSRVENAINQIHNNPTQIIGDTLKPLKHNKNYWRYRIGKYRILYFAAVEERQIIFSDFDSRGGIYN